MSTVNRKVGYYNFVFCKNSDDGSKFFNNKIFIDFMKYLNLTSREQRLKKNNSTKKAIIFDSAIKSDIIFNDDNEKEKFISYKVLFKSCKFQHVPALMDSDTGEERLSDKKPNEGEVEKTHLYLVVTKEEVKVISEERRSGVSINAIIDYLDKMLKSYYKSKKTKKDFSLIYGLVQNTDFIKTLRNMERVVAAELYIDKKILGSEAYTLLDRNDDNLRRDIIISMKSKKSTSLGRHNFIELYKRLTGSGSEVHKIRIYGKNDNNKDIFLDSTIMKRISHIEAELDSKGIVISNSIFREMEEIMKCEKI